MLRAVHDFPQFTIHHLFKKLGLERMLEDYSSSCAYVVLAPTVIVCKLFLFSKTESSDHREIQPANLFSAPGPTIAKYRLRGTNHSRFQCNLVTASLFLLFYREIPHICSPMTLPNIVSTHQYRVSMFLWSVFSQHLHKEYVIIAIPQSSRRLIDI